MPAAVFQDEEISAARLTLAREAFLLFRTRCFWFLRPDLEVTAAHLPLIVRGLRLNGGHAGVLLAGRLLCP